MRVGATWGILLYMMTTETEKMCDRCNEAPAVSYNEDHYEAVCETCASFYNKHNCAGDHCYCIGGDENFDLYL